MGLMKRPLRRSLLRTAAALSLCLCAGWYSLPVTAEDAPQQTESGDAAQQDPAGGTGALHEEEAGSRYRENQWNYVDESMDISGGIPEDAGGTLARIRKNGKLTVATEPFFAPYEFIDPKLLGQDQYAGADMELARLIAKRMGVELEIVPLEFTEVLSSISAGKYDLAVSGLSYTPGRASVMEMSKGYHFSTGDAEVGLMIRSEDADEICSIDDLQDKDLIAQSGSLQELLVAQNVVLYRQFMRVPSVQDVYDALESGRADAAGVDINSARMYIENNPDCGLTLIEGIEFRLEEQFQGDRIAGVKDDLELMYFVNGVIDEVLASGQYEEWFDEAAARAAQLGL